LFPSSSNFISAEFLKFFPLTTEDVDTPLCSPKRHKKFAFCVRQYPPISLHIKHNISVFCLCSALKFSTDKNFNFLYVVPLSTTLHGG
jgi:hypothetical protein